MYAQQPTSALADGPRPATLAPPAVTALRQEAAGSNGQRVNMERTVSQDMRDEREDLKEAAEHSLNIIMDLDLDGKIRYVSPSWRDIIGSLPEEVTGKPVLDIIYAGADGFAETIESVRKYDSRSHIARFSVRLGAHSILHKRRSKPSALDGGEDPESLSPTEVLDEEEQILNLEAQGIMVYDRTTGAESHVGKHLVNIRTMLIVLDYVDGTAIGAPGSDHRSPRDACGVTRCGRRGPGPLPDWSR